MLRKMARERSGNSSMLQPFKPLVMISLHPTKQHALVPHSSCGDEFQSITLPVSPADSLQWSDLVNIKFNVIMDNIQEGTHMLSIRVMVCSFFYHL